MSNTHGRNRAWAATQIHHQVCHSVCENPNGALTQALQTQQLASGGNVGSRPIRADRRVVTGEELILQVYCPSKLPAYRRYVDSKRFDDVIRR
jgi:hypothetical protein